MKNNRLADFVRANGFVPLSWAGSTLSMNYVNIGDALSAVMVTLMSSAKVQRVPFKSQSLRMACVGTIGHGIIGGDVFFWGTGSSNWANPTKPAEERTPFKISADSNYTVTATRGPVSERILTGEPSGSVGVYGDPVWLLPRFYKPEIKKKWKLGVIVHLSELADREYEAHVRPELVRYGIPDDLKDDVHLISTVSSIGVDGIRGNIDEILACERIVSTSLHGMVFAESYGIPCMPFPTHGGPQGLNERDLRDEVHMDLRFVDLYRGLGQSTLSVYTQPNHMPTDWRDLMATIDRVWTPKAIDEQALIDAFPLDYKPLAAPAGATIWDHPLLTELKLQHDVKELKGGRPKVERRPKPPAPEKPIHPARPSILSRIFSFGRTS